MGDTAATELTHLGGQERMKYFPLGQHSPQAGSKTTGRVPGSAGNLSQERKVKPTKITLFFLSRKYDGFKGKGTVLQTLLFVTWVDCQHSPQINMMFLFD